MHTNHLPAGAGGDETVFDAGELTAQEQAALNAKDEVADDGAEAARAAQEAEEQQRQEQAARDAEAAAAATAEAQRLPTDPGDPPAAPKDFKAELDGIAEQYRSGLLDAVDYADAREALNRERAEHEAALANHQRAVSDFEAARAAQAEAAAKVEQDWATAYNKFAKDNAEFMGNALYVRDMQAVIDDILKREPAITNEKLLADAYKFVADYHKYEKPASKDNDPLIAALRERQKEQPGATLGDAPAARAETITGNESFDALDRMPITELEDVTASMSPAQLERYLRAAPGANATGRD